MTAAEQKTPARRKPAPKPSVGAAAAAAIPQPGVVEHLGLQWDPNVTPIGHALAVESSTWQVPASA